MSNESDTLDSLYQERVAIECEQAKLRKEEANLQQQIQAIKRKYEEYQASLTDINARFMKRKAELDRMGQVGSEEEDDFLFFSDDENDKDDEDFQAKQYQLILAKLIALNKNNFPNPNTHSEFCSVVEQLHDRYKLPICDKLCSKDQYNKCRCTLRLLPGWKFYYSVSTYYFQFQPRLLAGMLQLRPEGWSAYDWNTAMQAASEGKALLNTEDFKGTVVLMK